MEKYSVDFAEEASNKREGGQKRANCKCNVSLAKAEEVLLLVELEIYLDELREEKTLTWRQFVVLVLRFGLKGQKRETLEEISDILGLSMEEVQQIEQKAHHVLKHFLESREEIDILKVLCLDK